MNSKGFCFFYIIICCLHSLLWAIGNPVVRLGILLLFILVPLYHFIYVNLHYKTGPFIKALNALFLMLSIYGIILIISGEQITSPIFGVVKNQTYIIKIAKSLLPFYSFYAFTRNSVLNEKNTRWWVLIFFIVAIVSYYHNRQILLKEYMDYIQDWDGFTNNYGYAVASLIPLTIFFAKKPLIQYLLLGVCVIFALMSVKRGAILVSLLCLVYCVYYISIKGHKGPIGLRPILLSFMIIFFVYITIDNLLETNSFFNAKIGAAFQGDDNSRSDIASLMIYHLRNNATPFELLFGGGAYNTVRVTGYLAHNDWLELLMNQGLLGIIVYLIYWISLIKTWIKTAAHELYSNGIALFIIIFFTKTFFSMSYEEIDFYSMLVLAFCISRVDSGIFIQQQE